MKALIVVALLLVSFSAHAADTTFYFQGINQSTDSDPCDVNASLGRAMTPQAENTPFVPTNVFSLQEGPYGKTIQLSVKGNKIAARVTLTAAYLEGLRDDSEVTGLSLHVCAGKAGNINGVISIVTEKGEFAL